MNKLVLIAVLVLGATLTVEANIGSVDALKAKLRARYPGIGRGNIFGAGGSASAASAASAGAYGGNGGYYGGAGASAAASASAAGGIQRQAPLAYNYDYLEPAAPVQSRYGRVYGGESGAGAAAAASASAAASAGVAQHLPPPVPVKPVINLDTYRRPILSAYRQQQVAAPARFVASRPVYGGAAGAAAAASSAAGGSYGGGFGGAASSSASAAAGAGVGAGSGAAGIVGASGNTYSAAAGTYADAGNGRESSAYKRSTENIQNHEDGHVDDNHYYNAQSYGKTDDEKLHEAYNNNNEDIEQSPTLYRSKKSGENYAMDYAKSRRESGSGVLASDKHSSAFNKNSKRLIENVDQTHSREGNGIIEDTNVASAQDLNDADEEIYDSDGFNGEYAGAAGAAAASSAGSAGGRFGGAAASSAAAAAGAARY